MFELTHDSHGDAHQLALQGSLTIYEVREAHAALLQATRIAAGGEWVFDLQALEELDTAGAQLLLAVQRQLDTCGARMKISHPAQSVLELLELLRLTSLYPDVMPAKG